jgi:hypothetical protein
MENKAQHLLNLLGTNTGPDGLEKVAELTDDMPINRDGIENHIALLQKLLNRSKLGTNSHIQGLANVGIVKMGLG